MTQLGKEPRRYPKKVNRSPVGHNLDIEFSEERADPDDWEALERSERADARQEKNQKL
ncbi:YfhD family protein [Paenibacillus sp. CAA11]|uniref:YfhD family protein n=1 Tax=Paenibacillus sp. CAA11 TaxID=1532905 RepID=UPI000D37A61E|nr:YfhD family protein [Paenibacillus sp. CAA11]AWB45422.1 YfhD family protein [Paenibacillus sp. CAA11]